MRQPLYLAVVIFVVVFFETVESNTVCKRKFVSSLELLPSRVVNKKASGSMSHKFEFECPDNRPIMIGFGNDSQLTCGQEVECVENCYNSDKCESKIGDSVRNDFATKISCVQSRNAKCNLTCCHSQLFDLHECSQATTQVSGNVAVSKKLAVKRDLSARKSTPKKETSISMCDMKPTESGAKCSVKPACKGGRIPRANEGSITNYMCNKSAPMMVNGANFATTPFVCGKKPCNTTCHTDMSCTNKGYNYYASKFQCLTAKGDTEPYRCVFTCCKSNQTKLQNCTWHNSTESKIDKGDNYVLVIRRARFFPYQIEICGMKKLDDCGAMGPLPSAGGVQISVTAESAIVPSGGLNIQKTNAQLRREGCGPIDLLVLLDNSGSLHTSGFMNEKTFINGIFNYFDFESTAGTNKSRAALMDFGDTAQLQWDFANYENDPSADAHLTKALMSIPYKGAYITNTFSVLEAAIEFWKKQSATKRPGARQITLLITDGFPNAPDGDSSLLARQERFSKDLLTLESVSGEQLYTSTTSIDLLINYPGLILERTTFAWTNADLSQLSKAQVQQICLGTKATTSAPAPSNPSKCIEFAQRCNKTDDCCQKSTATLHFVVNCNTGICACDFPGVDTGIMDGCCSNGKLNALEGCDLGGKFDFCAGGDCAVGLNCTSTPETVTATSMMEPYFFGKYGVCM